MDELIERLRLRAAAHGGHKLLEEAAAALEAAREDAERMKGGGVVLPRYFLDFLLGQGPLEGFWFGDKPATEKGQFWWRSRLRALHNAAIDQARGKGVAGA